MLFPESAHLLAELSEEGQKIEDYVCQGCRSGKDNIYSGCAECKIRLCVDEKGIKHCGKCQNFPCEKLIAFQNDGRIHHLDVLSNIDDLNLKGASKWLKKQKERWKCKCGYSFSWYEDVCRVCFRKLNSYESM